MRTHTTHRTGTQPARPGEPVQIRAHRRAVKNLGQWTTARQFDIAASRGTVVFDFLTSRIEPGEIDIHLDLDRALVKLLVADGTHINDDDLRRVGRARVKDWTGQGTAGGRRVNLRGELRDADVRVHRGGIAILSQMLSRRSRAAARQADRDGRLERVDDTVLYDVRPAQLPVAPDLSS
jgi:hypothetical protein